MADPHCSGVYDDVIQEVTNPHCSGVYDDVKQGVTNSHCSGAYNDVTPEVVPINNTKSDESVSLNDSTCNYDETTQNDDIIVPNSRDIQADIISIKEGHDKNCNIIKPSHEGKSNPSLQRNRTELDRSHKFRRQIRRKSTANDGQLSGNQDGVITSQTGSAGDGLTDSISHSPATDGKEDQQQSETVDTSQNTEHAISSHQEQCSNNHDLNESEHSNTAQNDTSVKPCNVSKFLRDNQSFEGRRQVTIDKYRPPEPDKEEEEEEEGGGGGIQEFHLEDDREDEDESSVITKGFSKNESRLYHICEELLDTEERYVSRLNDLVTIKQNTAHILSEGLAKNMFINIEVIYQLHMDFLPALRDRVKTWTPASCLGDLMQRMTPFLKLYTDYVKNFQTASQLVLLWKGKNWQFARLVKDYSLRHRGSLDIGARMIEPVQRVPRYELLLKDYMKRLPEDSTDKEAIKKSLDKVSETASHFEEMMKRDARISMMVKLQRSLDGAVNIFSFSRDLVLNTEANVMNSRLKKLEQCSVYLFTDLLLITRDLHVRGSLRKKVKHVVNLAKAKVSLADPGSKSLVISTRLAEVRVEFRTAEEMVSWEHKLRFQLTECTKKKLVRRGTWQDMKSNKDLGLVSPRFVLPHTVSVCMACGLQFDTPKRKKHCAACGMVVCGKCSSHRMFLRYDMSEVQRVCHCCYSVLHMQRQNTT